MKNIFIIIMLLCSLFSAPSFAAQGSSMQPKQVRIVSTASLVDSANLLKAEEKTAVLQALRDVEQKHNVRMLVYTARRIEGGVARDYARTAVDSILKDKRAIICVITMADRQWYIAANNSMKEYAVRQDYGIDYISESMVPHLKNGDYASAFKSYAARTDTLLSYARDNGQAATSKKNPHTGPVNTTAAAIAFAVALVAAYLVRKSLIDDMSNVRPATEAGEYLLRDTFSLHEEHDTYLYTNTVVVPKSKSRGAGGSDGSSGGSGGGGRF